MEKVLVAMSGGVDSSCTAMKLLEEGYEVSGVTLRLCGDEDKDAKKTADKLGFSHKTIDLRDCFCDTIIKDFTESYKSGETPNPCIVCNKKIKFGKLMDYALENGFSHLATGHYAQVFLDENTGRYCLKKAKDLSKDQTYVLYSLSQHQLSHIMFPLGTETKAELREKAEKAGLHNASKSDSQDICFVPDGDYASFLEKHTKMPLTKGVMVDKHGNFLANHDGFEKFTIGQRKGLGVSFGKVQFVIGKEKQGHKIVIGDSEDLFKESLIARDVNFISIEKLVEPMRVHAKTRYSQKEQPATIYAEGDKVKVVFDEPQRAITPGQAVVFYDGDIVVGGGTIVI